MGDELLERVGESVALRAHVGEARDVVHGGIEPANRGELQCWASTQQPKFRGICFGG